MPVATSSTRSRSKAAETLTRRRSTAIRQGPPLPDLPAWTDLDASPKSKGNEQKRTRRARFLDAAPSLRFAAWTGALCIAVTLYVGHVYATQATLAALQQAERDNLRLHLTNQRLEGAYARMTGPDDILRRAAALGLDEGVAYGPTILIDE